MHLSWLVMKRLVVLPESWCEAEGIETTWMHLSWLVMKRVLTYEGSMIEMLAASLTHRACSCPLFQKLISIAI